VMARSASLPVSLPLVVAALGALTTLIVLWRIINQPGPNDFINVEYGAYIGLLLLIALTYGAIQAGGGVDTMRAEAESLQDRASSGVGGRDTAMATAGPAGASTVAEPPGPPPPAAPAAPASAIGDPAPPPPMPDPAPPSPAPDPSPAPAPEPEPPTPPTTAPEPPDTAPAPPQPGDDPAGPTA
jgi:outer membrane biosynthesis protein TonB